MSKRTHADYLNMWHSQLQSHFRTQQSIAKTRKAEYPALNAFRIFVSVNVWGWIFHYLKSRFGKKHPFLDYSHSSTNGIFKMHSVTAPENNNRIKMVLAADWATDTPESHLIGRLMKEEAADYSIHLGDTYFVGAAVEIQSNFIGKDASWPRGSSGSLAVPGNHEFYSNGNPYFKDLLPHMFARDASGTVHTQDASFFCLDNDHWRVIALDNGYYSVGRPIIEFIIQPDAHLDPKLIAWLQKEVATNPADTRGIVILSHIQYCSAFEPQFPKTAEALQKVFGPEKEVIWLWGHEHRFAVYGKYRSPEGIAAYGRCIGHGGMPVEIGKVKFGKKYYKQPVPKQLKECPPIYYDNRESRIIEDTIVGHNGYVVLTLDSNKLKIEYKDESTWLFREEWEVDPKGRLSSHNWSNPDINLAPPAIPQLSTNYHHATIIKR
jgi:hypothetical protein